MTWRPTCCGDPGDCQDARECPSNVPAGDGVRVQLEDQADEGVAHQMPYCPGGCGPIGIEDVVSGEFGAPDRIGADSCGECGEFIEWRHV